MSPDNDLLLTRITFELNDLKTNVRFRNAAAAKVNAGKIKAFLDELEVKVLGPGGSGNAAKPGVMAARRGGK
jgi:hypothetical protein